jgi:hypothetical protein
MWRGSGGDGDGEDGTAAGLAGDGEVAAVGFGDGATDGEAHAGAGRAVGLGAAAVEALEDEGLLGGVDADALVGDADGDGGGALLGGDGDGGAGEGVLGGVFEEVADDLLQDGGVGADFEAFGDGDAEGVVFFGPGAGFAGAVDEPADGDGGEVHLDLLGVELRHLDGFGDEAVEAIALFVDDGEQLVGLGGRDAAGEERSGCAFDGGERRAELVGDGVNHERAQALAFLGGFAAGDAFESLGALHGDGDETADGLRGFGGERDAAEDEQAAGADAGAQGNLNFAAVVAGAGQRVGEVVEVRDFDFGDAVFAGLVETVAIEQIEQAGAGGGDAGDGGGHGAEQSGDAFGLEELAAEAEEDFELALAAASFFGLVASLLREAAGEDGGGEKGEEREPVLRVGDGERADRRQEEEVVSRGGGKRDDDGVTQTPLGGENEDEEQKGERDGGGVDVKPAAVDEYNSGQSAERNKPANDRYRAARVHEEHSTA